MSENVIGKLEIRQIQRRVPYRSAVYFDGGYDNAVAIMPWIRAIGGPSVTVESISVGIHNARDAIHITTTSGGSILLQAHDWLIKEDVGFSICTTDRMRRDYVVL